MQRLLSRVRRRLLPALLLRLLRPRASEPLIRLGSPYGGWWVPTSVVRQSAVAYCAGAGEDVSFDLALLARGLQVTTFDPTPRAIEYVRTCIPPQPGFRFEPTGWWDEEADLRFFAPRDRRHVSHSVINLQRTRTFFVAPVAPVSVLARRLGDSHVDLIKMDIEGAEYRVLESLLQFGPSFQALCVEFDQPQPLIRTLKAIRRLRSAGFELAHIEQWNYTFVKAGLRAQRHP